MVQIKAFTTKSVVTLPNDSKKIESIFAFADKLLLGLSTGDVLVYTVNDPFSPSLNATLSEVHNELTKKPIAKIGLIKDASGIIILADGIIHLVDMNSFEPMEQLSDTKGATTFEVIDGVREPEPGYQCMVSKLAVACRRKLLLYEWRDSEFYGHREYTLPDRIRSLAFLDNDQIVCGLNSVFAILELNSGNVTTTVSPGQVEQTSYASVGMSYMGIGSKTPEPHSVRLGEKEGPVLVIRETSAQMVGTSNEIRDIDGKPTARLDESPVALGYSYPYLIMLYEGRLEVRNAETLSLLQTVSIPGVKWLSDGKLLFAANDQNVVRLLQEDLAGQVNVLASENEVKEAISLLNQIEPVLIKDKETMLRDLLMLQATEMFKQRQFVDALQLFSDISAPPSVVIALFPEEIAGKLTTSSQLSQSSDGDERLTLRRRKSTDSIPEPEPTTTELTADEFKTTVRKLQEYLSDTRRRIAKLMDTREKIKFQGFELSEEIYGDLGVAAALVDTTLFKCYIHISPALVGPLVRVANHCDVDVVKESLEREGKWRELVDFYYGKGLHREALTLLRQLGDDETKKMSGTLHTVMYLQKLDNTNLDIVLDFARWPIECDRENGEEIFITDTRESTSYSRQKVFKFLQSLDDPACYLAIKYLEHIIDDLGDSSPSMHNNLGLMYIKSIKNGDANNRMPSFIEYIKHSKKYRPDRLLLEIPTDNAEFLETRAILHGKRGEHERALELYAFEIDDPAQARAYCSALFEHDPEAGSQSLHTLLDLYLARLSVKPISKHKEHRAAILELLKSQGSRMSVEYVLKVLPADITVKDVASFLQSQIRSLHASVRISQLETSLRKVNLVRTEVELQELKSRHVTITNLKTCKTCMKRLGHSVISMYPNGDVVHYGCAKQYQENMETEERQKQSVTVDALQRER